MEEKTAEERAERALLHAPFLGLGKEAVLPLVAYEIRAATVAAYEKAAKLCDEREKRWRADDNREMAYAAEALTDEIRALAARLRGEAT